MQCNAVQRQMQTSSISRRHSKTIYIVQPCLHLHNTSSPKINGNHPTQNRSVLVKRNPPSSLPSLVRHESSKVYSPVPHHQLPPLLKRTEPPVSIKNPIRRIIHEASYSHLCPISIPAITTSRVSLRSSMRLIISLSFGLRGLAS